MTVIMNPVPRHLAHVLMSPDVNARFRFRPKRVIYDNPGSLGRRSSTVPLTAAFVMGLTMNRFPKKNGRFQKTTAQNVRKFLMKTFSGGSITMQLGWWSGLPEDSIKVVLENRDMGLSSAEFKRRVNETVVSALEKFGQYEVWLDYFRGMRRVEKPMKAYWKP